MGQLVEPLLGTEDARVWASWQREVAAHACTSLFSRRVDASRRVVGDALDGVSPTEWCLMWSGGKDSTVMSHLIRCDMGVSVSSASEKDDMDYPGEREYVTQLAEQWGLSLTVLAPKTSPQEWLVQNAGCLSPEGDHHSRDAELSRRFFYPVVEEHAARFRGVFLGLRAEESWGRKKNRMIRGHTYEKASGQVVCSPLADWSGRDVYAYAASRGIDLLPAYQCVALQHSREPWKIRKSWWLPSGGAVSRGAVMWLRHYWPTLYGRLVDWWPHVTRYA